jgi:hypothetical protein
MELSSRAQQVPQGERGTLVYLFDLEGHRYDALSVPTKVPFDTLLKPGQTAMTVRQFRIPVQLGQAGNWIYGPPITLLDVL